MHGCKLNGVTWCAPFSSSIWTKGLICCLSTKMKLRNWMEKLVQNKGKLLITIVKIESYVAYPNLGMSVKVFIWIFYLNVDLGLRRCTCKAMQMLEFPFDHACAILFEWSSKIFMNTLMFVVSFQCMNKHTLVSFEHRLLMTCSL